MTKLRLFIILISSPIWILCLSLFLLIIIPLTFAGLITTVIGYGFTGDWDW